MKRLCLDAAAEAGYRGWLLPSAPERVFQFGEGNFLRAFAQDWFDAANERAGWNGKCCLMEPRGGSGAAARINAQDGLYTLLLRGAEGGVPRESRRIVSSVSRCLDPREPEQWRAALRCAAGEDLRCVISNTTEAGIVFDPSARPDGDPPAPFPAKLTLFLHARFSAGLPGPVLLPCELIDRNGAVLRDCVLRYADLWSLGADFRRWVERDCLFCSTLVDRIVSGPVRDEAERARLEEEWGYRDPLAVVGERFGQWIIEGPAWLEEELPFRAASLPCPVVPDAGPYKTRKVRILNGAHTGFVPAALLAGFDLVRECMEDGTVRAFLDKLLFSEVLPFLPDEVTGARDFAQAVLDRFRNPYLDHALTSIALNSVSKWRTRVLPSLLAAAERGPAPACLVTSLAALAALYTSGPCLLREDGLLCRREDGRDVLLSDDRPVLEFFALRGEDAPGALASALLRREDFWGRDLSRVPGLEQAVSGTLARIRERGALAALADCA